MGGGNWNATAAITNAAPWASGETVTLVYRYSISGTTYSTTIVFTESKNSVTQATSGPSNSSVGAGTYVGATLTPNTMTNGKSIIFKST